MSELSNIQLAAYSSIGILCPILIWIGSKLSQTVKQSDHFSKEYVMRLPIVASAALFFMFLSFKYLKFDPSMLFSIYFLILSFVSLYSMTLMFFTSIGSGILTSPKILCKIHDNQWLDYALPRRFEFHPASLLSLFVSFIVCMCYWFTHNWIFNNIIACSIIIQSLAAISLETFTNGAIALGGLFVYDIFWVFRTGVMVKVATSLAPIAPVLLKIPHTFDKSVENQFAMLGLGDVVFPGLMIALLSRFDVYRSQKLGSRKKSFGNIYFHLSLLAYTIALYVALGITIIYRHPQPALLYLSPAGIFVPLFIALIRGEIPDLLNYSEVSPESESEPSNSQKEEKDVLKHQKNEELSNPTLEDQSKD